MNLESFHTSFHGFIMVSNDFSDAEKQIIHNSFHEKIIQNIFNLALSLTLWSFVAITFDTLFATQGVVTSVAFDGKIITHFLPTLIFIGVGFFVKLGIIHHFTKDKKVTLRVYEKMLALIPVFGFLLFSTMLLRKNILFLRAFRKYFGFLRKDAKWINLLFKKNQD